MSTLNRKQDTRNKIQMGGLVIKAGLQDVYELDKAVLLGMLVDAKAKLDEKDDAYFKRLKELGDREFNNK
jgi:conjugative transfer protein TraD